jgi:hypothetical protein
MKELFYYLRKKKWRTARIYIEALYIFYKVKFIRKSNKIYKKTWPYIFALFILFWGYCAYLKMSYDYSLVDNYAHFEALSSDYYTKWMTDGAPGQDPPK